MDTRELTIGDIRLHVLKANANDVTWYSQRKAFEEKQSPLYPLIRGHGFRTFVDVGANYGFISLLMRSADPSIRLVAIEPDPRLAELIADNFRLNGLAPPEIVNVIAGAEARDDTTFSLNPKSSLDNRVAMPDWEQRPVATRTVDSILAERGVEDPCFFKIDTQGYELHVLTGLEERLAQPGWLLKMEFAPDWLRSQGTDPLDALRYLVERYEVAECPPRLPYGTRSLDALFARPLAADELAPFLAYVVSLDREGRGWVDLVVRPS